MKKFLKILVSDSRAASAKRVVTLLMTVHFLITAFVILFLVVYLAIVTPKGTIDKDLVNLLGEILKDEMFIILSGLGFIGVENWADIQKEKAKALQQGLLSYGQYTAQDIPQGSIEKDNL